MSENQIRQEGESPVGMPLWVKAFVVVALILVAAFVVLHLTGLAPKHTLQ